jgi:hypothetical protein
VIEQEGSSLEGAVIMGSAKCEEKRCCLLKMVLIIMFTLEYLLHVMLNALHTVSFCQHHVVQKTLTSISCTGLPDLRQVMQSGLGG